MQPLGSRKLSLVLTPKSRFFADRAIVSLHCGCLFATQLLFT